MAQKVSAQAESNVDGIKDELIKNGTKYVKYFLVIGIVVLLVAIFSPTEVLDVISFIIWLIAISLILYGGFCIYYALKFAHFKLDAVGNEIILPLVEVLLGLLIIVVI